ncbi:MDR/zinc-dependent alcohol dehydrogenase-like family protein [Aquibium microcysteis]|uniref:MDR/zinc-dependent alcohol dehydrogenase-like family protein n=1 Tax=Aquibium microcysteis TaxID=675281 RepID=UPI00165D091F|nr:zinc-binding dehydrogenase [Aquibium microcysteis]
MNMHAKTDTRRERVSSRVMRAAVLTGPRTIDLREVPMPEPGPGEVRVRLEGCGVCASNVTPWTGPEWMRFPTAPGDLGHEGWGVVDAVGRDVRQLREGDRVTTLFQKSYAEFDVGPADQAVPLPSALGDAPLPGEPLGCAVNVIRRARLQPGETVAVVGLGFMGLLLVRLASLAGARVVAVGRKPQARARALDMGAAMAVATEDAAASAAEIARDGLFDCVIEATGYQEPLDLAATLTTTRGRLVIAGYHQDAPRRVDMQLWNWRGLDVINAHERDPAVYLEGTREAVTLVAAGQLDPAPLYTHVLPFDRLNEALELAATRPEGFVKSLVVMP